MLGCESPDRMKLVIHKAAGIGERKGAKNLENTIQGSVEDYTKRILEF